MDEQHKKTDKFIKQGEIYHDRDARIAKAESDANEVIEEIQQEKKRTDKEFPNNQIINELSRVFGNGPLIWKPGQRNLVKNVPLRTTGRPDSATACVFQNGPLNWNPSNKSTTKHIHSNEEATSSITFSSNESKGLTNSHDKGKDCSNGTSFPGSKTNDDYSGVAPNEMQPVLHSKLTKSKALCNVSVNKFHGSKSLKEREAGFTALSAEVEAKAKHVTGTRKRDILEAKAEAVAKAGVVLANGKVCVKVKKKPDGTIYVPGAHLELGKAHARAEASLTLKSKQLGSQVKLRAGVEAEATAFSAKVGKVKLEELDNKGGEINAKLQLKGLDIKAGNVHVARERIGAKAEASVKATGLEVNTGNVSVVGQDNSIQATAEVEAGVKVTAGNVAVVGLGAKGANVRAEATTGIQAGNIQVGIKRRTGASFSTQPQIGNVDLTIGPPSLNVGLLGTLNVGIPFLGGGTGGCSGESGTGGASAESGTGGASAECGTGGSSAECGTGGSSAGGTANTDDGINGLWTEGLSQSETDANSNGGLVLNGQNDNQASEYIEGSQYLGTSNGTVNGDAYGSLAIGDMDGQLMENCTVNPDGEFVRSESEALIVLDGASEADMEHIAMILNGQNASNPQHLADSSQQDQENYHGRTDSIYLDNEEFDYEDEFGNDKDTIYKRTKKASTRQTNGTEDFTKDGLHGISNGNNRVPMSSIKENIEHGGSHKPVMLGNAAISKHSRGNHRLSSQIPLLPNKSKLPNKGLTVSSSNTNGGKIAGNSLQSSGQNGKYLSSPDQRARASPVTGTSGTRPSSKQSRPNSRIESLPPISDTNGIARPKTANYNEIMRKRVVQAVNPNIPTGTVKPIPKHYDRDRLKNDFLCAYIPSYTQKGNSKPQPGATGGIGRVGGTGSGNMYSSQGNEEPRRRKEKKKPSGLNKNIHTIFTIDDYEDGRPLKDYGNFVGFGDD